MTDFNFEKSRFSRYNAFTKITPQLKYCIFLITVIMTNNLSAEVYKWKDKNGKIHYSDKPFDEADKPLTLDQKPTAKQRSQAKQKADQLLKNNKRIRSNLQEDKNDRIKQQNKQLKIDKACQVLQRELSILNQPVRVYYVDDNGKEHYYSEKERQAEKAALRKTIKDNCTKK